MKEPDSIGTREFQIEDGAFVGVPVWESHKRGVNYLAKIDIDPNSPAGLAREFAQKARGSFYYIIPDWLQAGVPVEFAGDYVTAGGNRTRSRFYGVCIEIDDAKAVFREYRNGKDAVKASRAMAGQEQVQPETTGPLAEFDTDDLIAELERRGYQVTQGEG